jgi:hypothetical protein
LVALARRGHDWIEPRSLKLAAVTGIAGVGIAFPDRTLWRLCFIAVVN